MRLTAKSKIPKRKLLLLVMTVLLFLGILIPMRLIGAEISRNLEQMQGQMELFDDIWAARSLDFVILFPYEGEIRKSTSDDWSDSLLLRRVLINEFRDLEHSPTITALVLLPDGEEAASHVSPYTVVAWPSPLTHGLIESFNDSVARGRHENPFYPIIAEDLLTHHRQIYHYFGRTGFGRVLWHWERAMETHGQQNRAYLDRLFGGEGE